MSEFTDIDYSHAPYVSSKQAREALTKLASEHRLNFTHNPGGGAFYNDKLGECQIQMCDDVADYEKVRDWLAGLAGKVGEDDTNYKLFAFQPSGHGEPSFFVMALTEHEARAKVDAWFDENRFDEDGQPDVTISRQRDAWDDESYGEDYYEMTVAERGEVLTNENS